MRPDFPPLEFLKLAGSPADVAYQLGKRRRSKIAKRVGYWNRQLAKLFQGKSSELKSLETGFYRCAREARSVFLEEIRAMAQGAAQPFKEIFRLNLTELAGYAEKCTDLIARYRTVARSGILIAHNEDWNPRRNDVFLLRADLPELSYATLAYDGYLPGLSAGMNSHGLCHSVNFLRPKDLRIGLPRIFLTRYLLTASSIDDFLRFCRRSNRAFGQAIHLAQRNRYLGLELSARQVILRHPRLPTVHTNHYLAPSLVRSMPPGEENSLIRLRTAKKILQIFLAREELESLTAEKIRRLAIRLLSDRSALPYPIWRRTEDYTGSSATLASALVRTVPLRMEVFRHPPLEDQRIFRIEF